MNLETTVRLRQYKKELKIAELATEKANKNFHDIRKDRDKWKSYAMKVREENTKLKLKLQ